MRRVAPPALRSSGRKALAIMPRPKGGKRPVRQWNTAKIRNSIITAPRPGRAQQQMKIFGFAGWSGSGKTTLIEQVIPRFARAGLKVSLIKHAHHRFDVDHPGKDSYRLREGRLRRSAGHLETALGADARGARRTGGDIGGADRAHVALRPAADRGLQVLPFAQARNLPRGQRQAAAVSRGRTYRGAGDGHAAASAFARVRPGRLR